MKIVYWQGFFQRFSDKRLKCTDEMSVYIRTRIKWVNSISITSNFRAEMIKQT